MFKCECGKEFINPQSFNGHKCHCKVHQIAKHGSLDYIEEVKLNNAKKYSENAMVKKEEREKQKLLIWISEKHTCEKCGKIMTEKFGSGRFCSRVCANSHEVSDKSKAKVSSSLKKFYAINGSIKSSNDTKSNKKSRSIIKPKKYCVQCGKLIHYYNKTGFCKYCLCNTPEGKLIELDIGRRASETIAKNGTRHGWQSRNITSYPEQFFIKVLDNNFIKYTREFVVRKLDGINNYFLDFYIEINNIKLDLEIDGKQHEYEDRKASDIERDEYLTSIGYTIYRIKWNEINSEDGKLKMKNKIDNFLEYYKKL